MDELRRGAEALLKDQFMDISQLSPEALQRMFHELRVHQIELQMQNEELRRTQIELEVSRKKYADLYNFAPVGYVTVNQEGVILELNLTAATQLQRPRDALIGTSLYHYIAEDDRDAFFRCLRRAFGSHTHEGCELKLITENGSTFWAQVEGIVLLEAAHCQIIIADIAERKRVEQALLATAQRLQTVIETVAEGITLSDEHGRFEIFNSKMEEITGYTLEDANHASDFLTLLHPDPAVRTKIAADIRRLLTQGGRAYGRNRDSRQKWRGKNAHRLHHAPSRKKRTLLSQRVSRHYAPERDRTEIAAGIPHQKRTAAGSQSPRRQ